MELPVLVTLLAVLTTAAASECTVCFNGRCLATSGFYGGETKLSTGRMAIDYANNILYQYDNGIKAIDLNTNTMTPVTTPGQGNFLAVDQQNGDVYYYKNTKDNPISISKYQPKINHTELITIANPGNKQGPLSMWVYYGIMYFNTHKESGYDVAPGLHTFRGYVPEEVPGFENVAPISIVYGRNGHTYIKSGNFIYKFIQDNMQTELFKEGRYLLAGDKNGQVYLFDITKRYIYKVNFDTNELDEVGAYDASRDGRKRPNVKEFIFDGNNNLLLKETDGQLSITKALRQSVPSRMKPIPDVQESLNYEVITKVMKVNESVHFFFLGTKNVIYAVTYIICILNNTAKPL